MHVRMVTPEYFGRLDGQAGFDETIIALFDAVPVLQMHSTFYGLRISRLMWDI